MPIDKSFKIPYTDLKIEIKKFTQNKWRLDYIDLRPKRQNVYTVNNMKDEHVKVDKILAFLKAVGQYKRI